MKTLKAAQWKELKRTVSCASADLEHITELLIAEIQSAPNVVAKLGIRTAVQATAQRHFWLALSDAAYRDFGLDLPEYAKATGTKARRLVDREAVRFSRRLVAA